MRSRQLCGRAERGRGEAAKTYEVMFPRLLYHKNYFHTSGGKRYNKSILKRQIKAFAEAA